MGGNVIDKKTMKSQLIQAIKVEDPVVMRYFDQRFMDDFTRLL